MDTFKMRLKFGNKTLVLSKFQHRLWQSSAIVGAVMGAQIIGAQIAVADDFVVDGPSATQNDGNTFNGGDSLTITDTGSITITNNDAIISAVDGNTVSNAGSISTTGSFFEGMDLLNNNTVSNSGSISTTGNSAIGVNVLNVNTIGNSGSISTTGNNASGISANDNNAIDNSGLVSTTGDEAYGIDVEDVNTIGNSGSISTTGARAFGVRARDNNKIDNSGSISTTAIDANGINALDNNTIGNSGSISTNGTSAIGINARNGDTISNTGSISTTGVDAIGIDVINLNTISNFGMISTTGNSASGINGIENNTISNFGTISTAGIGASGVSVFDNNTINNSSSISTSGTGADGILAHSFNTVTNSGSVVSAQADSFSFTGADNTLNLLAPSFIGGRIDVGANATVNITTGPSHSVLWDFSTGTLNGGLLNINGTVPYFYNSTTQQFATFDPTVFAASSDHLAGVSGMLSGVMQGRLERDGSVSNGSNLNAFAAADGQTKLSKRIDEAFSEGSSSYAPDTSSIWLSALGARFNYDGTSTTNEREITNWGVAAGYDWMHSGDLKLGVMGGYLEGSLDANSGFANTYNNETSGFFAGVYGRKTIDNYFIDFALTGGSSEHLDSRFVNDNLAPLGVSYANGSYNGYWLSPEIAIGAHYDAGDGWTNSPSARLRYASQWLDGYTESGPSAANAVVGDRQAAIGEASIEWAATKSFDMGTATLRIGYQYQTSLGDDASSVTMLGQTKSIASFSEDRNAVYFGANTNFQLSDTMNLELGGKATFGDHFDGVEGNIKLVATF